MKRLVNVLLLTAALILSARADEFTIHPYLTGDRNEMAFYPVDESNSQWHSVDDPGAHDGNATYIWSMESASFQGLRSNDADIPATIDGTIDTVRVLIVARNNSGVVPFSAFVDTIGAYTEWISTSANFGVTFDSNWFAWTVCPWTGTTWTRQNLIDLEFGVRSGYPGLGDSAIVTQCHAAVIWTSGAGSAGMRRRRIVGPHRPQRCDTTVVGAPVIRREGHETH